MSVKPVIGAALVLALAPAWAAAEFNYTNVDLRYVDIELDNGLVDVDGTGYEIAGAYALNDQFFVLGAYESQDFDFGVDGEQIEAGFGYNHPFSANLDFVATGSLLRYEVSAAGQSVDDDAIAVGGGVRARPAEPFEVEAALKYVNYDEAGSDTAIEVLGRWYFMPNMALSVGMDLNDDFDTFRLGLRAEF